MKRFPLAASRGPVRLLPAACALVLLVGACGPAPGATGEASAGAQDDPADGAFWRPVVMGTRGIVSAEHPLEAQAGIEVLRAGGNAVDAAVAVFYMTGVVEQFSAGVGGDAFILAYLADEDRVAFINGTGPAPALATIERYREEGGIPDAGPLSTDVPGAVAGFDLLHRRYGTMAYDELLAPAIEAGRDGHGLSYWAASYHEATLEKISSFPSSVRALLKAEGQPHRAGEVFVQPDLGRSLATIAAEGADAFYRGSLARRSAEFYEARGGLLRYEDLAGYEAEEYASVRTDYRGYEVHEAAPNSQGIALLIALNILEGFDLKAMGHNSPDYVHVVTEAIKLAFADRDRWVADPAFVDVPSDALLSKEYAEARRSLIRMDRAIAGAAPPGDPEGGAAVLEGSEIAYEEGPVPVATAGLRGAGGGSGPPGSAPAARDPGPARAAHGAAHADPSGETSSFSIADRHGNVVSVTHSVNSSYGSGMVVEGTGFVLNNRMPYFYLDEGDVNALEPGKRTRHTINPALALRDGRPFLAWNTPGGDNQPQAMLQAFLAVVEFGMNVQQAVEAPTVTSSSFRASNHPHEVGGELEMPRVLADRVADALAERGHQVVVGALQQPYRQAPSGAGAVKMVMIDPETGVMMGGAAPAKNDYVMAW